MKSDSKYVIENVTDLQGEADMDSSDLLTAAESASYLRYKQSTIRAWIWKKKITYMKVGESIPAALRSRFID